MPRCFVSAHFVFAELDSIFRISLQTDIQTIPKAFHTLSIHSLNKGNTWELKVILCDHHEMMMPHGSKAEGSNHE